MMSSFPIGWFGAYLFACTNTLGGLGIIMPPPIADPDMVEIIPVHVRDFYPKALKLEPQRVGELVAVPTVDLPWGLSELIDRGDNQPLDLGPLHVYLRS